MRVPILTALAAVALTAGLAACSSSGSGTPEGDTVSQPTSPGTSAGISVDSGSTSATAPAAPATSTSASSIPPTSTAPAVKVIPAPSTPVRTATVTSPDGKTVYDIKIWVEATSATCADHAYGTQVIQYLTAHPCRGLTRILATTVVGGRAVGFAQSSLGFVGTDPEVYKTAGNFATLELKDGTGSINDLLREGYRLPSGPTHVPSPDAFDVEAQDSGVAIVDAFYLSGSTPNNDPALVTMAKDIYLQF